MNLLLFVGGWIAGIVFVVMQSGKRPDATSKNPYSWPTAKYGGAGRPYWWQSGTERAGPVRGFWLWLLLYPFVAVGAGNLMR